MRSKKLLLNTSVSIMLHLINSIMSLVVRKIFQDTLGADVLGINSVYSSILAMLSLSELGFGLIVSVGLYKPLAEKNNEKIAAYMNFLQRVYNLLGVLIALVGIIIVPLVPHMLHETFEDEFIYISFIIYLLTVSSSYFFSYKRTLLTADQNAYVAQAVTIVSKIILNVLYVLILVYRPSYYLYLIAGLLCGLLENVVVAYICNKMYPQVKIKDSKLTKEEKTGIFQKIKGMMCLNIGNYLITGADSIIISKFIGTVVVAYYMNYQLIINMLNAIFSNFSANVISTIGNILYTDRDRLEDTIKKILLIQYFLFGTSTALFIVLSTDFIKIFFGNESVLSYIIVVLLALNYYLNGFTNGIESIRYAVGLYEKDSVINLVVPIINVILSICLVNEFGVVGVVVGTLVCYIIKKIIVLPMYIANEIEEFSLYWYYGKLIMYIIFTIINVFVLQIISYFIVVNGLLDWLVKALGLFMIEIIINLVFFAKNKTFKLLVGTLFLKK